MLSQTRMAHHVSQADLDILDLLTSDESKMGPLAAPRQQTQHQQTQVPAAAWKKSMPRRDQPMDALLISAVLAGSGPMSRHHFGHGTVRPGAYASCDDSQPGTPLANPLPSRVVMKSMQGPRSKRLAAQREAEAHTRAEKPGESSTAPVKSPSRSPSDQVSPLRTARALPGSHGSGSKDGSKPKRRMSIDPAPVSQMLQAASPNNNFFQTGYPQPGLALHRPSLASQGRTQVKCMARTRVPTPHGEIFLHLYHNSEDNKEHLAVVIDPIQLSPEAKALAPKSRREIRSRTLDEKWREGETEMERVVRGAYVGRLGPGGEDRASTPQPPHGSLPENGTADTVIDEDDILPLVRIHSECFTGETIGSMRCDCGEQLDEAMRLIAQPGTLASKKFVESMFPTPAASRSPSPTSQPDTSDAAMVPGRGVVIYMRQEGRGIGLLEKIRAYNLQDLGHDTVTANLMLGHGADERKYSVAAEMLRDLGLAGDAHEKGIRLLTNNPEKVEGLAAEGIKVLERVGMVPRDWKCRDHGRQDEAEYEDWRTRRAGVGLIGAGRTHGPELEKYLRTKVERMGHMIDIPQE